MSPTPQETANFVTFTGEILNGKLRYLCSVINIGYRNEFGTQKSQNISIIDVSEEAIGSVQ